MATNILVVDDSHVERVLVEGLLRKHPEYRIRLAVDGRDAMEVHSGRLAGPGRDRLDHAGNGWSGVGAGHSATVRRAARHSDDGLRR